MLRGVAAFFTDSFLLKKFFAIFVGLLCFRFLTSVPLPQIDPLTLQALLTQNQILGVLNLFSGGGLSNFSIAMLGVIPYISVAIVAQLLKAISPKIRSMYHDEGEIGRKKIGQWIRVATLPVAILNAVGILLYFQSQRVLPDLSLTDFLFTTLLIVTGAMITMWLGELITEFSITNGISLIVFAGIVVSIPTLVAQVVNSFSPDFLVNYIFAGLGILIGSAVIVWMNEADRPIPVTYAHYGVAYGAQTRRVQTYIPIKVNPIGVLSVIFALSVSVFFQQVFTFAERSSSEFISTVAVAVSGVLANGYYYGILLAAITFLMTYFIAPIIFDTDKVAENLQKQGAFVVGLRPGEETIAYLAKVAHHLLFYAAVFVTIVASLPYFITGSTTGTFLFSVGGTGAMIIVSVVLDVYKKTASRLNDRLTV